MNGFLPSEEVNSSWSRDLKHLLVSQEPTYLDRWSHVSSITRATPIRSTSDMENSFTPSCFRMKLHRGTAEPLQYQYYNRVVLACCDL